jgi:nitrite reductase/ring-hydroxylating ferredoxin subunit
MAEQAAETWHRVAELGDLAEGTVRMVKAGDKVLALSHVAGHYGALANACPHMGGPLGQGQIENGFLVCPWHGREYDPVTGVCQGFDEAVAAFPVEARADGIYVRVPTDGAAT